MEHYAIINSDIMLTEFWGSQTRLQGHPTAEGPSSAQLPGRGEAPLDPWCCGSSGALCASVSSSLLSLLGIVPLGVRMCQDLPGRQVPGHHVTGLGLRLA